jgi:hypothetical protein
MNKRSTIGLWRDVRRARRGPPEGIAVLRRRAERDQGLTVTGSVGPSTLVSLGW